MHDKNAVLKDKKKKTFNKETLKLAIVGVLCLGVGYGYSALQASSKADDDERVTASSSATNSKYRYGTFDSQMVGQGVVFNNIEYDYNDAHNALSLGLEMVEELDEQVKSGTEINKEDLYGLARVFQALDFYNYYGGLPEGQSFLAKYNELIDYPSSDGYKTVRDYIWDEFQSNYSDSRILRDKGNGDLLNESGLSKEQKEEFLTLYRNMKLLSSLYMKSTTKANTDDYDYEPLSVLQQMNEVDAYVDYSVSNPYGEEDVDFLYKYYNKTDFFDKKERIDIYDDGNNGLIGSDMEKYRSDTLTVW